MKILHIISGGLWAGAEVQVYNTLTAFTKQSDLSLECVLFNEGILKIKFEEKGIKTILIDESELSVFEIITKLHNEIKIWKPDVVHVHAVKEHFVAKLAIFSSLRKIPLVRTVHGARKAPDYLSLLKSIRSNSVVYTDNFLITNAADAVIAISKSLEEEFYQRKVKGRICQIYNAINPQEYNVEKDRKRLRQTYCVEDTFWIGTAARLAEPKNLKMLIAAGRHLDEAGVPFKISIFGEGPLKDELQNQINDSSLSEKIELHGFEKYITPIIQSFDAFVLCSIHEGLPMVLLEAMLLNTPLVCTDVIGINEVVENGKNGLLVPFNDSKSLARSLLALYYDKDLSLKLTNNAKTILDSKFSFEKTTMQLLNVYSTLNGN